VSRKEDRSFQTWNVKNHYAVAKQLAKFHGSTGDHEGHELVWL